MKPRYEGDMQSTEHAQMMAPDSMPEHATPHTSHRRLLSRQEVELVLHLTEDQVQFLINTRQITRIRVTGEERFDSRDIDSLIEVYKATAVRRDQ